ncbi:Ni/Fe hydrogenase subunit alpha [Candidatus Woesearchaeota archaeon]|nr:Ni/Fe hydrogenase subunit alpha [Candidatus Woesearchaeota archaeon]
MSENIKLNHICKVEGHADLAVKIAGGKLVKCELGAVEGARFFEGLVVGRKWDELKEITSRICGICSVAHCTASIKAVEDAFGMRPTKQTRILREFLNIGERIRSHATHLYMLSLPDFLGFESAIGMASKHKQELERALHLIKLGNEIVTTLAGRQMHPVAAIVGGFTHVLTEEEVTHLKEVVRGARAAAIETLKLFLSLEYPDMQRDVEHICIYQKGRVPLIDGVVVSDHGLHVEPSDYGALIEEYIQPYSTAKFAVRDDKEYVLGALARVNNTWDAVAPDIRALVKKSKHKFPSKNPFHNLIAQAVELAHWVDVGERLLDELDPEQEPAQEVKPKQGRGVGITEAPRGLLFHEYEFDEDGVCTSCRIMTPTCQFLKAQEADVRHYVQHLLGRGAAKEEIIFEIEKLIRAYDPCFSCSAHFLNVDWQES